MKIFSLRTLLGVVTSMLMSVGVAGFVTGCESDNSDSGSSAVIITQSAYDQILRNLTYERVVSIIGSPGVPSKGNAGTTGWWTWKNGNGSGATVSFIDNRVYDKTSFGNLPKSNSGGSGGSGGGNCTDNANRIELNMSASQVNNIMGRPDHTGTSYDGSERQSYWQCGGHTISVDFQPGDRVYLVMVDGQILKMRSSYY